MPPAVRVVAFGVLLAILAGFALGSAAAEDRGASKRLALVIGEAAYPEARLSTADADAGLIATAFAQAGFDVTAVADADAALLRRTIAAFAAKARGAGPGVVPAVYVSGYGLQYDGENWLVPVGARIASATDVPENAMRLSEITAAVESIPATTRLFLFDLSREVPFVRKGLPLAGGLVLAEAPIGSVYGFNTAPGAVAPADLPPYGSYARALAEAMQTPGLSLSEVLRRVRLRVGERTNGAAVPFDDGSADPSFAFFLGPAPSATPLTTIAGVAATLAYSTAVARDTLPGYVEFIAAFPRDPLVGRVRAMAAARRETLFWSEAVRANTPRAYWTYMRRYPRGPHFGDVRRQLFALHAALEPPPRFDIVSFEGLPPPPQEELAALEHLTFGDADGPPIPPPPATLLPPTRNAFYETLPPPPIAPAGSLPLPLPVMTSNGRVDAAGIIDEPAVPSGALVAAMSGGRDNVVLTTTKSDGTVVSRLASRFERSGRTAEETAAGGATISKVTIATGADGALTTTQVGPAKELLSRWLSRDAAEGGRATTLFDASGQAIAATIVSPTEIVMASAVFPGKTLPARFILIAANKSGGEPEIVPEGNAPRSVATAAPVVTKGEASKSEAALRGTISGVASKGLTPSVTGDAAKPPAMPAAAGLTGQAPTLNLPPPPPTPAFDAAAAPVAATPPSVEPAAAPAAKLPDSGGPSPASGPAASPPLSVPAPAAPSPKPPAALPVPQMAQPELKPLPQQHTPEAAHLPNDPPLPPRRSPSIEPKAKPRGGR